MTDSSHDENQRIISDFLGMVERLYFENYSLRQILQSSQLPDGTLAVPNWQELLQDRLSNKLLADVIHEKKFGPLFARIRETTRAEVVDEVLRSIERASEEE
jgi:hypothetical protein